jgi:hypothetical protein
VTSGARKIAVEGAPSPLLLDCAVGVAKVLNVSKLVTVSERQPELIGGVILTYSIIIELVVKGRDKQ